MTVVSSTNAFATADLGSNSKDPLVAPGTKNDTGIVFTVTGTPEVNVAVTLTIGDNHKEVFLKAANDLPDMTTADATDDFDLAADYYPVVFTLTVAEGKATEKTYTGTMAAIKTALETETSGAFGSEYAAGTDLSSVLGTIRLTWAWDYGAFTTDTGHDKADTLLGDLAAGTALAPATTLTAGTDYNLQELVDISINIAQVD